MATTDKEAKPPVMSLSEAFDTIKAVGRGEAPLPEWAGKRVYIGEAAQRYWEQLETATESLDSFSKLLSENQDLIAAIARERPVSIADLATRVQRAESNVSRTLAKLVKLGIVQMIPAATGRTKRPALTMEKVRFDLNLLTGEMTFAGMKTPEQAE
jgi:predicted transcriptional regulator